MPACVAEPVVKDERLHIGGDASEFAYPAFAVWAPDKSPELMEDALRILRLVAQKAGDAKREIMQEAGAEEVLGADITPVDEDVTNGITESFHRSIKLIQRRAFGFRNFVNYRRRVRAPCA